MTQNKTAVNFNTEIELASRTAWQSEKGGDDNWIGFLNSYGVNPLSKEEKDYLLNSEMKITRGAYPIELRRVYEKIIEKYSVNQDEQLKSTVNNFNMEARINEYYQKIKPFAGLGDIFKNASTGTAKYSQGLQKAKQLTIKCKNCGAPRLEEMQYDNCLFCGSKLFETTE